MVRYTANRRSTRSVVRPFTCSVHSSTPVDASRAPERPAMKRLLVIDQDPRMLAEVSDALERSGYSVFTTTHITDASCLHDHGGLDGIIAPLHVATHPTLGVRSRAQAGAPPLPFIALIERGRTR